MTLAINFNALEIGVGATKGRVDGWDVEARDDLD
ncbi:unnamed protein product [uncultured virus]|nr:unnamed protein product [uncultured virus]